MERRFMESKRLEPKSSLGTSIGPVVREALQVAVLGCALSLMANGLSPRGLSLTRDYFPSNVSPKSGGQEPAQDGVETSAAVEAVPAVDDRLRGQGFEPVVDERMHGLFTDSRYTQQLVVFIDAREARRYQEGHIPGAYQFDRYRQEEFLPRILPACQNADYVVVYCNGGECEDSHFAAMTLRDAGVPADRIGVYSAGITSWEKRGYPIETGDRGSGVIGEGRRGP